MRVGSPFFTLDDLLEPHEQSYASGSGSSSGNSLLSGRSSKLIRDIDDLNRDISHAAIKLLLRGCPDSGLFPAVPAPMKADLSSFLDKPLQKRPPCRFEIISKEESVTLNDGSSFTAEIAVVLDIAHNPDAFAALVDKAKQLYAGLPIRYCINFLLSIAKKSNMPTVLQSIKVLCWLCLKIKIWRGACRRCCGCWTTISHTYIARRL